MDGFSNNQTNMAKRIAIIALKEDDFGVESNLLFSNHGPAIPKSLLQRNAIGMTRAKVAVSVMTNMNDTIKNLRYNQHLTDRMSISYINIQAKKVRTSIIQFEEIHESILKWAASCVVPFTGVVWVDSNWEAVSRTIRRIVPTRPLLLQAITAPFFRPLSDAMETSSSASGNERRSSLSGGPPPVFVSNQHPSGRSGGGTDRQRQRQQENQNPFGPSHSEAALRRAKKCAPGGIYGNNRNPGPYRLPAPSRGRAATISIRPICDHFITIAEKQSIGPGPQFMYSSFGGSSSSRPSTSMGFGGARSRGGGGGGGSSSGQPSRPASTAGRTRSRRRPSSVGGNSPRVHFPKAARFIRSAQHTGISEKVVVNNDMVCVVRSQTPGPRYFLGCNTDTLGGRNTSMGFNRVSQSCSKQRGAPSASFPRSPRFL